MDARFNAVCALLKLAEFEQYLLSWNAALREISGGQNVAIDGKRLEKHL